MDGKMKKRNEFDQMEPRFLDVLVGNLDDKELGTVLRFMGNHEWGHPIPETDPKLRVIMILAKKYNDLTNGLYGEG